MLRILILVLIYVVMGTMLAFLLTTGQLKPIPWMPIFFAMMMAFGIVVLRSKGAERLMSDPVYSKFAWKHWLLLIWAIVSFGAAFYGVLMFVSGRGGRGDLGGAMGATVWGLILVYVLRIIYKKNAQSSSPNGLSDR